MSSTVHRSWSSAAAAPLLLVLLMTVLGLLHAGPARATGNPQPAAAPDEGPYLGVMLDWATDSAADHAGRLGAPAGLYGRPVPLPMSEQEQGYLRDYFGQVSA